MRAALIFWPLLGSTYSLHSRHQSLESNVETVRQLLTGADLDDGPGSSLQRIQPPAQSAN
jgi:hypothetical protein